MNQKKKSKEELYLLKVFEIGRDMTPVDPYKVGIAIGCRSKSVDTIVQNLCKNNFLKKEGKEVHLTKLGLSLAQSLLD